LQEILQTITTDVSNFWERQSRADEIVRIRNEKAKRAAEKKEQRTHERLACGCSTKMLKVARRSGRAAMRARGPLRPLQEAEQLFKPKAAEPAVPTRSKLQSLRRSIWKASPIGSAVSRGCAFHKGDVVAWDHAPDSEDEEDEEDVFFWGPGGRKWELRGGGRAKVVAVDRDTGKIKLRKLVQSLDEGWQVVDSISPWLATDGWVHTDD